MGRRREKEEEDTQVSGVAVPAAERLSPGRAGVRSGRKGVLLGMPERCGGAGRESGPGLAVHTCISGEGLG